MVFWLDITPFNKNKGNDLFKDYNKPPKTQYQEYLRKNSDKLYDHIAPNHSEEIINRISHIEQGKNHASFITPKDPRVIISELNNAISEIFKRFDPI